jgi:hypothetical protein
MSVKEVGEWSLVENKSWFASDASGVVLFIREMVRPVEKKQTIQTQTVLHVVSCHLSV